MTPDVLIRSGILLALSGTALGGLFAIIGGARLHRFSQYTVFIANAIGALAILWFLVSGMQHITVYVLPLAFESTFALDRLSAVFLFLVTSVSALSALYAIPYLEGYSKIYHVPSLNFLTALFILGMESVLLSTNMLSFLFCWEMMSIASFFLVMADREAESVRAALLYLIMTQLGAFAILAGFFLLMHGMPSFSFASLPVALPHAGPLRLAVACALLLFGFGSKAGLVPFHVWLPEAHPQAPSHISALMSGVMLKVAVYGFLRFLLLLSPLPSSFGLVVILLGLASAVFGVLRAVIHPDIKRTLAYSSIENLGLIFTMIGLSMYARSEGLALLGTVALGAALLHSVSHAFFKSGLFFSAGLIVHAVHSRNLEVMGGLAKRMPAFSVAFLLLALAASAMPPFGAFLSEWMLLHGLLSTLAGLSLFPKAILTVTLLTVVFVSGLAIFAMVKLFAIASLGEPRSEAAAKAHAPSLLASGPIFFCALLSLFAGIFGAFFLSRLQHLDASLLAQPLQAIHVGIGSLHPGILCMTLLGILAVTFIVWWTVSSHKRRQYHTWDCGQPITAGMEYTATAFSSPIRFFFRFLLHSRKRVIATPVLPSNPWIAKRSLSLNVETVWFGGVYNGIRDVFFWISRCVRRIQSGAVQFYLFLIFLALIISLLVAL